MAAHKAWLTNPYSNLECFSIKASIEVKYVARGKMRSVKSLKEGSENNDKTNI